MVVHKLLGWLNTQRLVKLAFRASPNSEFIIFQDQRLTRGQVLARVETLAAGLQALGIQKGDRVVTLLPACPEAIYTAFLPGVLGTINVPLNPLLREHELRHILADCQAKAVITTRNWYGQDYPAMLERLLPGLPHLRYVIVRDAGDGDGGTFLPLKGVMSLSRSLRQAKVSSDDTLLISYTSGTTGLPKGVVHTRSGGLGLVGRAVRSRMNLRALRCMLLPYPPHQIAGLSGIVISLLAGGKVILMDRLNPQLMLEYIQDEKVTQIGGSPTMYQLLLNTPGQERYDLSSVQRIAFSSEPIPPELARALHERLGCSLENLYGPLLHLRFEGANPDTQVVGKDHLAGIVNYFIGNDPANWRTSVPTYGSIVYEQLYPGIDLLYSGSEGTLKGTYVVDSGANPGDIRWRYDGASKVELSKGELLIRAGETGDAPPLVERKPIAWQVVAGKRKLVSVRYAIHRDGSVGFVLGKYDGP